MLINWKTWSGSGWTVAMSRSISYPSPKNSLGSNIYRKPKFDSIWVSILYLHKAGFHYINSKLKVSRQVQQSG